MIIGIILGILGTYLAYFFVTVNVSPDWSDKGMHNSINQSPINASHAPPVHQSTQSPINKNHVLECILVSIESASNKINSIQSRSLSDTSRNISELFYQTESESIRKDILSQLDRIHQILSDEIEYLKLPGSESYILEQLSINKFYLDSIKSDNNSLSI